MLTFLRIFSPPNRAPNRLSLSASSIMTNAGFVLEQVYFRIIETIADHTCNNPSCQCRFIARNVHDLDIMTLCCTEVDERHEFARFAAVQRTLLVATPIFMHHDYQTLISTRKFFFA
ncbi:hypothetical protein KCU87_g338, partial [Aureobasidium melanogenum]